ncbi:MAG: BT_3928 family protein, partial [Prevotella sp.]
MRYSALSSSATNVCRFVVALTFLASGFVKAVDPIGSQIKIEDYLAAWGMAQMVPEVLTLTAAVALSATEFTLGMLLLFAIRRRMVTKLIMVFMAVMTPLTLWLAISNPVSDCGCFGDAVVLTNWETFFKNVVLTAAALLLVMRPMGMVRFVSRGTQWIVINYTILFVLGLSAYSLYILPPFDFRPYHVGADIRKGMEIPEDAEQPQFETTFILEKNGERREFTLDDYPDSTWTFIDSRTVQTSEGYVPPIHDFTITRIADDEDITEEVVNSDGYTMLLVAPYLEKSDDMQFSDINRMYDYAKDNGVPFYCLTASSMANIEKWKDMTGAEYPFCLTDATTLRTIIRSSPGLVVMKDGKIIGKWSHNALPDETQATSPIEKSVVGTMPADLTSKRAAWIVSWFVIPLLLLTIADRLWAWTTWVRSKERSSIIYQLLKKNKKMRKKIVAGNWKMNMNLQ